MHHQQFSDCFPIFPTSTHALPLHAADQALIGYCKIIAEINRNKYVMRYRTEPRLTDRGKHDFKVGTCCYAGAFSLQALSHQRICCTIFAI
jgi:hypothetical protein